MKKKSEIEIEIDSVSCDLHDDYSQGLLLALKTYHSLIESGKMKPRGNRLAIDYSYAQSSKQ
jgi:hypothetical protein